MRKIEKKMLSAIAERRNWKLDNTEVIKYFLKEEACSQ